MHLIMSAESGFTNKNIDSKYNDDSATRQSQDTNKNANNSIVSSSHKSVNNNMNATSNTNSEST